MFKAPAIYFPSTVAFFDDDHLYAKLLIERLCIHKLKHFESSEFLLRQRLNDFLFVDRDMYKSESIQGLKYLKNNLCSLKKSGNLISVVISDLHMDNCLGTELLSKIASPYVGKILVSNFIDYQKNDDITEARNSGSIDIVLDKTKNFIEELPKAISLAKNKFFINLSNALYSNYCDEHPLLDTEFANFFMDKIDEYKPNEIRANSTFNRFDFCFENGNPNFCLHVAEKEEIDSYLESSAAETAPKELVAHLTSGKYLLCHDKDVLPDGKMWSLFVRPAKQFRGKHTTYFYSVSEANQAF